MTAAGLPRIREKRGADKLLAPLEPLIAHQLDGGSGEGAGV